MKSKGRPTNGQGREVMESVLGAAARPAIAFMPPPAVKEGFHIHDVVLHHLRTPQEVESIVSLRDEIDLSVHAASGRQQFETLEKKETSAGSSSVSSLAASGSARSASSRWATN
jgi:hypothetical protein